MLTLKKLWKDNEELIHESARLVTNEVHKMLRGKSKQATET